MEPHHSVLHRRLLIISFNIYNGASIDPFRDLIVKSKSNYSFKVCKHRGSYAKELRLADHLSSTELPCAGISSIIHSKTLLVLVLLRG